MPKLPISIRRVAVFAGIFLLILFMMEFNSRLEELNRLNDQRDQVRTAATQAVQTQTSLLTQVAYAGSDAAVDEWARTQGHYLQEGDHPVIPIAEPGSAPLVVNTPIPTPTQLQNWEVWWQLYFGD